MLDSYQAEKGSTSSLYESLFNHVFEVPSLLTDESDQDETRLHSMIEYYVCSRLISDTDAKNMYLAKLLTNDIIGLVDFSIQKDNASYISEIKNKIAIKFDNLSTNCNVCNALLKFDEDQIFKKTLTNDERLEIVATEVIRKLIFKNLEYYIDFSLKISKIYFNNRNYELNKYKYKYYQLNTYYLYLIHHDEITENDAQVVILTLRQFINYLTIHSWGNCKRLSTLFESFIRPYEQRDTYPNAMSWQQFPLRVIFNEYQQDRKKFSVQNATVILLHKHYIFYKHLNTQFNKKLACCHFESTYQFQAY